jgi:demethylmenaquinone methyltransferase/2-methoxy-6-polyprenyl-1,4-benzoquinol methylase
MKSDKALLTEQINYYRARASEYDEWFLRIGRYDRGEEHKRQWLAEVEQVRKALADFGPRGRILELACGTGWWTEQLVPYADSLTAVDASPEVIALNRQRVQSGKVEYIQADIFEWVPPQSYEVVFFSFWLSHVPPGRFDEFWALVRRCTGPRGRAFFIDSLYTPEGTAKNQPLSAPAATTSVRRLNDGQTFEIIKVFYEPAQLAQRVEALGWQAEARATETYFLYGSAVPEG